MAAVPFLRDFCRPSYWRCSVANTSDASVIERRGEAKRQDPTAPALIRFRAELSSIVNPADATLDTIAALRHWVRTQQSQDPEIWLDLSADTGDIDPELLLAQQRARMPGACRRFAYVLCGGLLSMGIPARVVSLQAFFFDRLGHIMVEAWVEEVNKWVLVDPTHDTMFLVDGRYASLLELRKAMLAGIKDHVRFERNGSTLEPSPKIEYFTEISKNAFIILNECHFVDPPLKKASLAQFPVIHYVDGYTEPYPRFALDVLAMRTVAFAASTLARSFGRNTTISSLR